jgi:hypothetical protein
MRMSMSCWTLIWYSTLLETTVTAWSAKKVGQWMRMTRNSVARLLVQPSERMVAGLHGPTGVLHQVALDQRVHLEVI